MSKADIEFIEKRLEDREAEFHSLVGVKKTPEVFRQRQQLKNEILPTLRRWVKELKSLPDA